MVFDLLLIALAITLDPLPVMAFVLVVASARGVWKGLAFILGWLACFVAVIALVLSLTGGQPPPPRSPPSTAALVAKLVIGLSLVLYAAYRRRRSARERTPGGVTPAAPQPHSPGPDPSGPDPSGPNPSGPHSPGPNPSGATPSGPDPSGPVASSHRGASSSLGGHMDRGSVGAAAGLAVLLQPWGLVAAGALTVVEADTSHLSTWLALFSFCVLATASLLAAELYVVLAPARAGRRLLGMRTWMERHQEQAIVVGSLVIGLWLVGKSLYELTG
ncbi:GAP family protein [Streptomyces sp. NPDC003247]|uniref:GAP family protein n=1 Tax=Streptomyces sp. NPDC003247 TaxID=3364677 RepID=UPI003699B493